MPAQTGHQGMFPGGQAFLLCMLIWLCGSLAQAAEPVPPAAEGMSVAANDAEAAADGTDLPDPTPAATVALATIAPGEIYWERFGHNMLLVTPPGRETLSFNFGYFDFEQPGFIRRFILGRMLYQALAFAAEDDLAAYVSDDRGIVVQDLALTPRQADDLLRSLAEAVRPENRDYLYEYFRANCSTRVRDAIDSALGGGLRRQTSGRSRGFTYRMHAARLAKDDAWLALGIDLGLGPDTDRRLSLWEEMFIPGMLQRYLRDVVNSEGEPLVTNERVLHPGRGNAPAELPPDRRTSFAATGLSVAVLLLWLSSRARARRGAARALEFTAFLLHLLFGVAGAVLLFLWLGTDHVAAHRNENLMLLNPLSLALAALWLLGPRATKSGNTLAWLVGLSAMCGLAVKVVPDTFIQQNLHWCLLFIPIHVSLLVAWRRSTVTR